MKRSKRYNGTVKDIDQNSYYSLEDAVKSSKELASAKFDETIELHVSYSLSEKEAQTPIRGSITLPNPFGVEKKVLVITNDSKQKEAKKAGADYIGLDDIIEKIEKGFEDFDVVIATPDAMPKVAKLGKQLGPKGLMPNPKTGTVTEDVDEAVKIYKAGKVDYKSDDNGTVHIGIGKSSMDIKMLVENADTALQSIIKSGRAAINKVPRRIYISSTMGPSLKVKFEV